MQYRLSEAAERRQQLLAPLTLPFLTSHIRYSAWAPALQLPFSPGEGSMKISWSTLLSSS
jgi:hypothetical protein